jgi:hypothetical protein
MTINQSIKKSIIQAPLYNCSLSLYYLLVIKFNWTNEKLVKIERYVHAFIITFTVGTSIAGLPLTMYNKVTSVCWVIGYPSECGNSNSNPSNVPCERGDWAWLFGIILFYGPLWICVLLTIIAMAMIYIQVRNTLRKNERYNFARRPSVMNTNTNHHHRATGSVITEDSSTRPKSGSGVSTINHAGSITAAGQMSSRESRTSNFQSERTELEELDAAIEREDMAEEGADVADDADDADDAVEMKEEPAELAPPLRNAYNTEVSGGIGLKSGWMAANAATGAKRTTIATNEQATTTESTRNRFALPKILTRNNSRAQQKQNLFATQAILYSGSFFITWTPSTIWSVAYWFGVGGIGFDIAAASCEPLQGFWNMLIFIRSRPSSQEKLRRVFGNFCCFWLALLPNMPDN